MITKLKHIQSGKLTWIHGIRPSDQDLEYLKEKFGFHPLDISDVKTVSLRPKLDEYPDYLFMILLFPYYDRLNREIKASEIDFFIGDNYIVTISDGIIQQLDQFFLDCQRSESTAKLYMHGNSAGLLHEIIHRLQSYTFPMLDHITLDIDNIEKQIFSGQERKIVRELLIIKRNIVAFRRIMQSHQTIIRKLMDKHKTFFDPDSINLYFNNLLERSNDIWDILNTHKETIDAFSSTNESLISFKLNDIIKILTMISVMIVPGSLIASIFGMNATHTPIVNGQYGFWILLGIIVSIMLTFLVWFKKKDWL